MTFEYVKYVLPMRRRNQARGLTILGKRRATIARPQLAGLSGRSYHTEYMRLVRGSRTRRPASYKR